MEPETAGDPVTGLKWTRRTTEKIADELRSLGIVISAKTVARLLRQLDYSLRVNHKKRSHGSRPERNQQFELIAQLRERFAASKDPLISIDTKKRELVGCFRNPGTTWQREPVAVNDHDFRSLASGVAIPYGIYDLHGNRGTLFVGTSYDTPEFSADNIERWWRLEGSNLYSHSRHVGILADCGGSNANNSRVWKRRLHECLCIRHGLKVTVAHYPPGTSKWNPIEHRLFSAISNNWAGTPLDSYETILKYIRTTKTSTGLRVRARLVRKQYQKGQKVTDDEMQALALDRHDPLPAWNYTLAPP